MTDWRLPIAGTDRPRDPRSPGTPGTPGTVRTPGTAGTPTLPTLVGNPPLVPGSPVVPVEPGHGSARTPTRGTRASGVRTLAGGGTPGLAKQQDTGRRGRRPVAPAQPGYAWASPGAAGHPRSCGLVYCSTVGCSAVPRSAVGHLRRDGRASRDLGRKGGKEGVGRDEDCHLPRCAKCGSGQNRSKIVPGRRDTRGGERDGRYHLLKRHLLARMTDRVVYRRVAAGEPGGGPDGGDEDTGGRVPARRDTGGWKRGIVGAGPDLGETAVAADATK
jgi:hypothetical protein